MDISNAAVSVDYSDNTAGVDLTGGNYGDVLRGGSRDDKLDGGAGNDVLEGGRGSNTINGGDGIDLLSYEHFKGDGYGVYIDLMLNRAIELGSTPFYFWPVDDRLSGIENVRGSKYDDYIEAGEGRNVIEGGGGADRIVSRRADARPDSTDVASYLHSASGVTVNLTTGVNTGGDAQGDTLFDFDNLYGSTHDDHLTGNDNANTIRGFGGADTISTGAGNDRVFISSTPTLVDGGADLDVLSIATGGASSPSVLLTDANFQNFERVNVYGSSRVNMSGVSQGLLIRSASTAGNAARIYGTRGNDRIYGGDGADVLRGGGGNDVICAGEANQTIEGGAGDDLIDASTGTGANNPQDTFNMKMAGFGRDTIRGSADALSNDIFQVAGLGESYNDLVFAEYSNGAIVTGASGQPGDGVFFSNLTVDQAKGLNFRFDQPST